MLTVSFTSSRKKIGVEGDAHFGQSMHADLTRMAVIVQDWDDSGFRGASGEAGTSRVSGETTHRGGFNQSTSPINIFCSTQGDSDR
jgi:hypothetical protein